MSLLKDISQLVHPIAGLGRQYSVMLKVEAC